MEAVQKDFDTFKAIVFTTKDGIATWRDVLNLFTTTSGQAFFTDVLLAEDKEFYVKMVPITSLNQPFYMILQYTMLPLYDTIDLHAFLPGMIDKHVSIFPNEANNGQYIVPTPKSIIGDRSMLFFTSGITRPFMSFKQFLQYASDEQLYNFYTSLRQIILEYETSDMFPIQINTRPSDKNWFHLRIDETGYSSSLPFTTMKLEPWNKFFQGHFEHL